MRSDRQTGARAAFASIPHVTALLSIAILTVSVLCEAGGRTPLAQASRSVEQATIAGLTLVVREERLIVSEVEPGSAAYAAGLLPGDRILIVNDVSLIDLDVMSPQAALELMSRSPSPRIRLLVGRGAGTLGVVLPRNPEAGTRRLPSPHDPPGIGAEAPLFSATDLKGREVELESLRGGPVLIDFWASWCPPCRSAALTLKRLAGEHGAWLRIIGVSLDEDRQAFEAFAYNLHLPGHQIFDGGWYGPIADQYGIAFVGIPYSILIGKDGRIVAADSSLLAIEKEIAQLSAAESKPEAE
jgi:thiol-disulfide isomerase/thioredoxin